MEGYWGGAGRVHPAPRKVPLWGPTVVTVVRSPLYLRQCCHSASQRGSRSCSFLCLCLPGAGILAMANAGPDTNGSQFFVTLAPTQWLDGKHTIFGRVCQGIGMVNRVGMVETNSQDRPVDDVKILKAYPSG